jgi:hypothetical protein
VKEHDMQDERLQALARRLGAAPAQRLDVERTAAAVVRRLREQAPVTPAWWLRPVWLRVAAAVVLMLGAGVVYRGTAPQEPAVPVVAWPPVDGLRDLTSEQLRVLLQSLDQPMLPVLEEEGLVSSQEAGLEDLSSTQLRALLSSLEG